MICDNRNIPSLDIDNNTIVGTDQDTYYRATDQRYPLDTPFLDNNSKKSGQNSGLLVASQEELNTMEQAPVIFSSSILVDPETNEPISEHNDATSTKKVNLPNVSKSSVEQIVAQSGLQTVTTPITVNDTKVNSQNNDVVITTLNNKPLINAILTNSSIKCECPAPPVCPVTVPCPNLDYKWMQTNFYIVVGLLVMIIILMWITRNKKR